MDTNLQSFADAFGALAVVGANETGEWRFRTGQSYERCTTDAERAGWIAAWNETFRDLESLAEMEMA